MPLTLVAVERPEQDGGLVVDVDPRHVLIAARHRAAEAEPKRRQQLLQQAAGRIEDEAGADDDQAYAGAADLVGGALPLLDDLGPEILTGGRGLVHQALAAVSVVADRRLADQHPRLALQGRDRLHQVAGAGAAALHDRRLRFLGPALGDRLPDQVDHPVDLVECLGRGALHARLPAEPAHRGVGLAGPLGIPGQPDDLVPAGEQRVADGGAERPAGAADQDPHAGTVWKVPVWSLKRAMPALLASSTTAAATAGATSRLKTEGMM